MCLFACSLTPPKRAADTVELKLGGMISLGVQMVLGQKLPDSTNGTLENKKKTLMILATIILITSYLLPPLLKLQYYHGIVELGESSFQNYFNISKVRSSQS